MELNYKEKSIILAALDELIWVKDWKKNINLVDLQEVVRRQDIENLIDKVAGACHTDLDNGTDQTLTDRHRVVDTRGLNSLYTAPWARTPRPEELV